MKIFIRVKGRKIELDVSEDLTFREVKEEFREVKEKYYSALGDFTDVNFIYKGVVPKDEERLCDCDVEDGDVIIASPYARAGGGHICPYGCGRKIPDNYKGCTELLKDHPNYFK